MPKPNRNTYNLYSDQFDNNTVVSADQISSGVTGNIRDSIKKIDSAAYSNLNTLKYTINSDHMEIPLNSNVDSDGDYTISFDVAGSGFSQPLRYDEGLAGKDNVWLNDGNKRVHIKKGEEGHKYVYTASDNTDVMIPSEKVETLSKLKTDVVFGEGGVLNKKDIRKLEENEGRKVTYSISGPKIQIFNVKNIGSFNAGDYKIENTREYIKTLGKMHLDALKNNPEFINSKKHINFSFTGHSRGGVGVVEGAMLLKHLVNSEYKEFADRIHFNTVLFDPVPGPKDRIKSNINQVCNLKEQTAEMQELGMDPMDKNDHTTVVYSIGCNHQSFFTPMKVLGADTVILTGHSHDEGLKDVENQYGDIQRKAYINSDNTQAYRGVGLSKMPSGVFIADENNVLIKPKSMDDVEKIIDKVYTRADKLGNDRIRRVVEAASDVHVRNGGLPSLDTVVRGFGAHDPWYVPSSDEFKKMRSAFEDFTKNYDSISNDPDKFVESISKIKETALKYVEIKSGKGPHSNRTQGRINIAKNILALVNEDKAASFDFFSREEIDDTPKEVNTRLAFIANAEKSLSDNRQFMDSMCERYKKNLPVEVDLFKQTLSGMLTDRFILNHKKQLLPGGTESDNSIEDFKKTRDLLFGDENGSLYSAFSNSKIVSNYAEHMLSGRSLDVFNDPETANQCLDSLIEMVKLEKNKEKENSEIKAPAEEKASELKEVKSEEIKML